MTLSLSCLHTYCCEALTSVWYLKPQSQTPHRELKPLYHLYQFCPTPSSSAPCRRPESDQITVDAGPCALPGLCTGGFFCSRLCLANCHCDSLKTPSDCVTSLFLTAPIFFTARCDRDQLQTEDLHVLAPTLLPAHLSHFHLLTAPHHDVFTVP